MTDDAILKAKVRVLRARARGDAWSDEARAAAAASRAKSGTTDAAGKVNRHVVISSKGGVHTAHFVGTSKHSGNEYKNFVGRSTSVEDLHKTIHAVYPAHANNVTIVHNGMVTGPRSDARKTAAAADDATALSDKANALSAVAKAKGDQQSHVDAENAHRAAGAAQQKAGRWGLVADHAAAMKAHAAAKTFAPSKAAQDPNWDRTDDDAGQPPGELDEEDDEDEDEDDTDDEELLRVKVMNERAKARGDAWSDEARAAAAATRRASSDSERANHLSAVANEGEAGRASSSTGNRQPTRQFASDHRQAAAAHMNAAASNGAVGNKAAVAVHMQKAAEHTKAAADITAANAKATADRNNNLASYGPSGKPRGDSRP